MQAAATAEKPRNQAFSGHFRAGRTYRGRIKDDHKIDPTCGSAGMLPSAITHLKEIHEEWRNVKLYGQELNHLTSAIGRMNLFLHDVEDFQIVQGDTLIRPAFLDSYGQLMQFDMVLANPPYSIKQWNRAAFSADPYGRNFLGIPPQGRADYAFLQHILKSLKKDTGRCAILFPHGVLFRNEETTMRKKLVEMDVVECVLGLGKNLFYNSPMEACIIICRTSKPIKRRHKVLFINAVDEVTRERAQSFLLPEHIAKIASAYHDFQTVDGFSYVATLKEIQQNDSSLSIPLYVRRVVGLKNESELQLKDSVNAWLKSSAELRESMQALLDTLADTSPNDPNGGGVTLDNNIPIDIEQPENTVGEHNPPPTYLRASGGGDRILELHSSPLWLCKAGKAHLPVRCSLRIE